MKHLVLLALVIASFAHASESNYTSYGTLFVPPVIAAFDPFAVSIQHQTLPTGFHPNPNGGDQIWVVPGFGGGIGYVVHYDPFAAQIANWSSQSYGQYGQGYGQGLNPWINGFLQQQQISQCRQLAAQYDIVLRADVEAACLYLSANQGGYGTPGQQPYGYQQAGYGYQQPSYGYGSYPNNQYPSLGYPGPNPYYGQTGYGNGFLSGTGQ